jgi:hypothetical protein
MERLITIETIRNENLVAEISKVGLEHTITVRQDGVTTHAERHGLGRQSFESIRRRARILVGLVGEPLKVRLGENLRDRLRARFFSDRYAAELGACSGQVVTASRVWRGQTGLVYAYNVVLPNGKTYHLPALYAVLVLA